MSPWTREPLLAAAKVPKTPQAASRFASRLADEERAALFPRATQKRAHEFFAGRVAAQRALARLARLHKRPARQLRVLVVAGGREQGRPRLVDPAGAESPWQVSITHDDGLALAAVAPEGRVGLDLVTLEPRGPGFCEEVFVDDEQREWPRALGLGPQPSAVWESVGFAAKEAALKLLGDGLRRALQQVAVLPRGSVEPGASVARVPLLLCVGALQLPLFSTLRIRGRRALVVAWCQEPLPDALPPP